VHLLEGVGNDAVVDEVNVDMARHGGREPLHGDSLCIARWAGKNVGADEFPSFVKRAAVQVAHVFRLEE
jgi:hypothetical protein